MPLRVSKRQPKGTNCTPREFLEKNRGQLGIRRLRKDMLLWSDADMISLAYYVTSPEATQLTRAIVDLVWREAVITHSKHWVSLEDYEALKLANEQLGEWVARLEYLFPTFETSGSAAGTALAAHKKLKGVFS